MILTRFRQRIEAGIRPETIVVTIVLLLICAFVTYVRLRYINLPLERDEGEYAYAGQLILHGIPPYQLVYNMKFPGAYYVYSLFFLFFGESLRGIHLGFLATNVLTIILLYILARRFFSSTYALVATATFAILSLDRNVLGMYAHATHFVILAVIAGCIVLFRAFESDRLGSYVWAGFLLSSAVLMKQHAVFFPLFGLLFVLWHSWKEQPRVVKRIIQRFLAMGIGVSLPILILFLAMYFQGVFQNFWFWTFQYAQAYISERTLLIGALSFTQNFSHLIQTNLILWNLGFIALYFLFKSRIKERGFLIGLFVASWLSIMPGLYFRPHYFVLVIPVMALLVGFLFQYAESLFVEKKSLIFFRSLAAILFSVIVLIYIVQEREYLFFMNNEELANIETKYIIQPFIPAIPIADYVRSHTSPTDTIAVIGSEPEILFYADRLPATGYIYMYPFFENQPYASSMAKEFISQVDAAQPLYVVYIGFQSSIPGGEGEQKRLLTQWSNAFVSNCYDTVGVADMDQNGIVNYRWDAEAVQYQPQTPNVVYIFKKNFQKCPNIVTSS